MRLPLLYSSLLFFLAGLLSRTYFCTYNLICCFLHHFRMGYGLHPTLSLHCSLDLIFKFGNVCSYFYRCFPSWFHYSTWCIPFYSQKRKKKKEKKIIIFGSIYIIFDPHSILITYQTSFLSFWYMKILIFKFSLQKVSISIYNCTSLFLRQFLPL